MEKKTRHLQTRAEGDTLMLAEGLELGIKDLQNKDTSKRSQATCFTFQA